jgi:SAD/SRA domain/Dam-replacing HTH domain
LAPPEPSPGNRRLEGVAWNQELRAFVVGTWAIGATFTLSDVYAYEGELAANHPANENVRDKIRQTLQHLRDAGLIEFVDDRGTYRRVAGVLGDQRIFGEIPGFAYGQGFPNRAAVSLAGLHPPLQAGISGGAGEGADSVVVSGAYEDDEDYGDLIVYTGAGGRDSQTSAQIAALDRYDAIKG